LLFLGFLLGSYPELEWACFCGMRDKSTKRNTERFRNLLNMMMDGPIMSLSIEDAVGLSELGSHFI
jgi:C4-type Zn-finger protein